MPNKTHQAAKTTTTPAPGTSTGPTPADPLLALGWLSPQERMRQLDAERRELERQQQEVQGRFEHVIKKARTVKRTFLPDKLRKDKNEIAALLDKLNDIADKQQGVADKWRSLREALNRIREERTRERREEPAKALTKQHEGEASAMLRRISGLEPSNIGGVVRTEGAPVVGPSGPEEIPESVTQVAELVRAKMGLFVSHDFNERTQAWLSRQARDTDEETPLAGAEVEELLGKKGVTALVGLGSLTTVHELRPVGPELRMPDVGVVQQRLAAQGMSEEARAADAPAIVELGQRYSKEIDAAVTKLRPTNKTVYVVTTGEGPLGYPDYRLSFEDPGEHPLVLNVAGMLVESIRFLDTASRLTDRMRADDFRATFRVASLSTLLGRSAGHMVVDATAGLLTGGAVGAASALLPELKVIAREAFHLATMDNPVTHVAGAAAAQVLPNLSELHQRFAHASKALEQVGHTFVNLQEKLSNLLDRAESTFQRVTTAVAEFSPGVVIDAADAASQAVSTAVKAVTGIVRSVAGKGGVHIAHKIMHEVMGGKEKLGTELTAQVEHAASSVERAKGYAVARGRREAAKPVAGSRITTSHASLAFGRETDALSYALRLPEIHSTAQHVTVMRVQLRERSGYDIGPLASYLKLRDVGLTAVIRSGAALDVSSVSVVEDETGRRFERVTATEATDPVGPRPTPPEETPTVESEWLTPVPRPAVRTMITRYLVEAISSAMAMTYLAPRLGAPYRGDIESWAKAVYGEQGRNLVSQVRQLTAPREVVDLPVGDQDLGLIRQFVLPWVVRLVTDREDLALAVRALVSGEDLKKGTLDAVTAFAKARLGKHGDTVERLRDHAAGFAAECQRVLDENLTEIVEVTKDIPIVGSAVESLGHEARQQRRQRERESRTVMAVLGAAMGAQKAALTGRSAPEKLIDEIIATPGATGAALKSALGHWIGGVEGYKFTETTAGRPEAVTSQALANTVLLARAVTDVHQAIAQDPTVISIVRWVPYVERTLALMELFGLTEQLPSYLRLSLRVTQSAISLHRGARNVTGFETIASMPPLGMATLQLIAAAGGGAAGYGARQLPALVSSGIEGIRTHAPEITAITGRKLVGLAHSGFQGLRTYSPAVMAAGGQLLLGLARRHPISRTMRSITAYGPLPPAPPPVEPYALTVLDTALRLADRARGGTTESLRRLGTAAVEPLATTLWTPSFRAEPLRPQDWLVATALAGAVLHQLGFSPTRIVSSLSPLW
ncbi:DUF4200 domain-containing protein [Streptoalloteichus hindustanus]|uniref:Uncharacterized protein n=1 Tax=Streptoalloteichus hindustanus TaxID=2017 RepID=A0A1M5CG65_STRHI|nr:DUF4200 domain-containing protein [Streptoalloteichus hindustanus]SHF53666.1 hypothetical protein SAMN05444320_10411 [Streptoalloteichus hindustanus]